MLFRKLFEASILKLLAHAVRFAIEPRYAVAVRRMTAIRALLSRPDQSTARLVSKPCTFARLSDWSWHLTGMLLPLKLRRKARPRMDMEPRLSTVTSRPLGACQWVHRAGCHHPESPRSNLIAFGSRAYSNRFDAYSQMLPSRIL